MKKCPYCSEEIQDEAIKCRYCGEFLNKSQEEKEKNIEKQKERVEQKTMKIYGGLNYYIKYLPYFGWEILSNDKVNYRTESSGNFSSKSGFFDKHSSSGTTEGTHINYYYNELILKRFRNQVEEELLDIEQSFFFHIENILKTTNYSYIKYGLIVMGIWFIIILFNDASFASLYTGWFIIGIVAILIGENFNFKIRKRNKEEKPKKNQYFDEIFQKYGLRF